MKDSYSEGGRMADEYSKLVADLAAERQALRIVLAGLADEAYDLPSPAEGWKLRDCVIHLAETDDTAAAIAAGLPPNPNAQRRPGEAGVLSPGQLAARELTPFQVFARWQKAGDHLVTTLQKFNGEERLSWVGRQMSIFSFTAARLMEHWSHGLDILDTVGVQPVDTDRLRHIAHLGYLTRDFSYRNRGMEPPGTRLFVELVAPSGAVWTWGSADAPDRIYGTAGDFCRVVTHHIHWSDTSLRIEGEHAQEFLTIAQAFAGPPGRGSKPKGSVK